jgi:hypothetical protein
MPVSRSDDAAPASAPSLDKCLPTALRAPYAQHGGTQGGGRIKEVALPTLYHARLTREESQVSRIFLTGGTMGNETVKLETPEQLAEAVSVLARELVNLKEVQEAQGRLVMAMDLRIKMLTALTDHDHGVLEKHGMVPPRPPEGGPLVN